MALQAQINIFISTQADVMAETVVPFWTMAEEGMFWSYASLIYVEYSVMRVNELILKQNNHQRYYC